MGSELILEIGTEEIPSDYLGNGLEALGRLAARYFQDNRIGPANGLDTYGTPRRLVLIAKGLSPKQDDLVQEINGPPKNVAYDENGNPTKAAMGFAQKQGVSVETLQCANTPRGEYLTIRRTIPGRQTIHVVAEIIPKLIADIPWPKSMRWGAVGFSFARPIHWILALFDGEVVPFEVAGVRSGSNTKGHRFMAPDVIGVTGVADYFKKMEASFVQVDQQKREWQVRNVAKEAAKTIGGMPSLDPELVTTVANLVEYPSAVCGGFDKAFLKLPDPVLITAMKKHQKYFAVYDENEKLMPHFVAINNTIARDETVVQRGHERVLRARLSDGEFFFQEDRRRPLADRLEDLKGVVYQADLGTSYEKVERFTSLAGYVGERVLPSKLEDIRRVARLCKCDLVTQMVVEFPTLQGVMGQEYARIEGYPEAICLGIYEHYLPTGAGGALPTSQLGAVVGVADRMDTIIGCFAVGLQPTGSADPFALRRHAIAILRILESMGWDVSLRGFIEEGVRILGQDIEFDNGGISTLVVDFFRERYKQMMLRAGHTSDLVEAVITAEFDRVCQLRERIEHLKRFVSESTEFRGLATTFKRVTNILKKQEVSYGVAPKLFQEPCESILWGKYQALKGDINACQEGRDYYGALNLLTRLKGPVDDFFDGVEVLTKDNQTLRENRIGLLQHVAGLFLRFADFSKFSI